MAFDRKTAWRPDAGRRHRVVDYYLNEGAEQAALAFVDAIEQAFRYIGRHPATGSARYA